jgi:hypothetical protein
MDDLKISLVGTLSSSLRLNTKRILYEHRLTLNCREKRNVDKVAAHFLKYLCA